eukprot:CAMPEP_0168556782 /NCGR_PEP_ID=MMETSP0413-20121227/9067_1 /TAXON_ID=136452 /ORGANISM="Filamoeba nolandi, Strain NC-AS-23-1" /LENGTH=446 /DNA_ID=CAMNT_0008587753 /DNA_START=170 /DNA_END=1510 /DNA_ORIENTATION=+
MSSPSIAERACSLYKESKWRQGTCSECFRPKEDHKKQMFEEKLGQNQLSNEDPTEVFELIDIIGTGAYGSVFLGRDLAKNEVFAIKFLELEESKGNEISSIVNEINIMKASIECPFIVEYHGCFFKDDTIMLVMEYCSCSVEDVLSYCPEIKFTETQIAAVCAAIIKGLAFLHAYGISHRDIKSGNVLLKETGEVKLADFGVSHRLTTEKDKMKTLAGSPYWCAPELITADSYDNKVDIWAAAICAIEMAEGQPPHWEMQPLEVILHIPKQPPPRLKEPQKWSKDFNDFIERCLQKNPMERSSAKQLLNHPFILSGSSTQILVPLLQQCLPIILPRKREELDAGNEEDEESEEGGGLKGTILAVDRNTYRVTDVVANEGSNQVNIQNQNVETVPIEKVLTKYQNMSITKNTVPTKKTAQSTRKGTKSAANARQSQVGTNPAQKKGK